ncbi:MULTISPECIES: hypothetical protein [Vagococcus]|uniref:Lipoprotein n=1 Tax=Vagococcus fluvialis bH819 TaxID=1255619 RepID=A0A1X6WPN8_9ENTE|nr:MULTISPECIES: hypothetical protein [Vagococcus]SLM86255.1 hypothetical protein FM121_09210 [Vagococcus fluvialis bH819]HCM88917.1 hypothetical protein [Vagococcus sp.]
MKKSIIFLALLNFNLSLFGCNSNNKQAIDNSISTSASSSEVKKEKLSKEYITGKWTSTEEDWPIEIEIYKNNDTEQLQLDITAPQDSVGTYTTASGYSSYSNPDNSIRYKFSLDLDNQLIMTKTFPNMKSNEVGAVRGWLLQKVED